MERERKRCEGGTLTEWIDVSDAGGILRGADLGLIEVFRSVQLRMNVVVRCSFLIRVYWVMHGQISLSPLLKKGGMSWMYRAILLSLRGLAIGPVGMMYTRRSS